MSARPSKRWVLPMTLSLAALSGGVASASGALGQPHAVARHIQGDDTTPGVPPGGPPSLYEALPALPELENHDPRFRAPYETVSGTERYVDGEYLYAGFPYDDNDSAYPTDWTRYANNSANLVEFRMAVYPGGVLYRFTFNTLLQNNSTIATVAFNTDHNTGTGTSTLPKDPGLPFPGTDEALTTWGTGAEWSHWTGTSWNNIPLHVVTDLDSNQVTVTVPDGVAFPTGQWSATLATGIYDPTTGGWLSIASNSTNKSNVVDLGFRFNEMQADPPWSKQTAALQAGDPTQFAHDLNFDWLRQGYNWDNVPTHGLMYRFFASRLPSAADDTGNAPSSDSTVDSLHTSATTGQVAWRSEGKDMNSLLDQYLSPLQPYAVYIPASYQPGQPTKLTFALHPSSGYYYWINDSGNHTIPLLGADRNSIVLSPGARGTAGFYVDDMENDVFEAWNDVARHYTLDPTRTTLFGYSMGGYGVYRLATLYPQLFARAAPVAPAGARGIYFPVFTNGYSAINTWLPNLRYVPIFHFSDIASESTFYPGQAQNVIGPDVDGMNSLEELKYRYIWRSIASDHFLIGTNFPDLVDWLGDNQTEPDPFHVTYVREPSNDDPRDGLVHNQAYWLSHIEIRDNSGTYPRGEIDAVSLGYGLTDPTSTSASPSAGTDADGLPYLQLERDWSAPGHVAAQDRIVITATNIGSVTIDPAAARVGCNVQLEIHSDGPLRVTLLGCKTQPGNTT